MRQAATEAFGDFKQLDKELDSYLKRSRITSYKVPPDKLTVGAVYIRELSAGEAAIMPVHIRSRRGVNDEQAGELVIEARAIAARFPSDPAVLASLAEAEHDAGNDEAAIAAADKALAIDPRRVNAHIQKGKSLFRLAEEASDQQSAFRTAIAAFQALNQLENDHPLPLVYYYRAFAAQGMKPTGLAWPGRWNWRLSTRACG